MLDKLINETWKTQLTAQTDSQGILAFRGFYGSYDITLKLPDGRVKVFEVHVSKNEENKWVFTTE
jgi:hypothetical protein